VRDSSRPKRFPMWVAALPGLLFMIVAMVSLVRASKAVNPAAGDPAVTPNKPACVDTYGITLNLSEYYVREWQLGDPVLPQRGDNKTPELSTVLRGMARNGCGEDVKNVRLKMVVHDDAGKKGEGFYFIEKMAAGEVTAFEKAWMGKVVTYEVTSNR